MSNSKKRVVIVSNSYLACDEMANEFFNNDYDVNVISDCSFNKKDIISYNCEINDSKRLEEIFNGIDEIDSLVIFPSCYLPKNIDDTTEEEFNRFANLIVKNTYNIIKYSIEKIRKKKGNILLLHSSVALNPEPGATIYSMLQATLVMLCKNLAIREGQNGVRVNTLALGPAKTDELSKTVSSKQFEEWKNVNPLGATFEFSDFLNIIVSIANGDGAYAKMTGTVIPIDGGESVADNYTITQKEGEY